MRRAGVPSPATPRGEIALAALVLAVAACTPQAPGSGVTDVPAPTPDAAAPEAAVPDPGTPDPAAPGLPARPDELPSLALAPVGTFATPVATAVTPDGQVLVAERAGTVRTLAGGGDGPVVLDVRARTTTDGERGLLDLAVAPWGDELFVSRTDPDGDTLVEAYPLAGSQVVDTPRTVYALPQPYPNHNGGSLVFLPDTTLLLGLGDGGGAGDPLGAGQDLTTPLGALVRLDVRDGVRIPADNPYVARAGAAPEIVAAGVRNPWRMSLDAARDELWVADVGQSSREELTRIPLGTLAGANLGWALREGTVAFTGDGAGRPRRTGVRLRARAGLFGHRRARLPRHGAAGARRRVRVRRPVRRAAAAARRRRRTRRRRRAGHLRRADRRLRRRRRRGAARPRARRARPAARGRLNGAGQPTKRTTAATTAMVTSSTRSTDDGSRRP